MASGYFMGSGVSSNFDRFNHQGSAMFNHGTTMPYLSPILTRFNPAKTLMRLFTDGGMVYELGSKDGDRIYKTKSEPAETGATATAAGMDPTSKQYTYKNQDAYTAYFADLQKHAPFRGYWLLMDMVSIAIWVAVVLGINKKMKIPLPVAAFAMAIDQLDIIFLALVAYKAVKP